MRLFEIQTYSASAEILSFIEFCFDLSLIKDFSLFILENKLNLVLFSSSILYYFDD